jgi:hypothetical protein
MTKTLKLAGVAFGLASALALPAGLVNLEDPERGTIVGSLADAERGTIPGSAEGTWLNH